MSVTFDPAKTGQAVSWTAPQNVPLPTLRDGMALAGFDPNMVKDMAPRNAFSRAARELSEERVIRKTREDETHVYFQFTKEYLDSRMAEFNYSKECELGVNKESGDVRCSSRSPDMSSFDAFKLAAEAEQMLKNHQSMRLKGDVTALVQKIFKSNEGLLVRMIDRGGMYFVPNAYKDLSDRVETLLKHVGGTLKRYTIYLGDPSTEVSVSEVMADHFREMIDEVRASVEELCENSENETFVKRTEKVQRQRAMLEANLVLLGAKVDEVTKALEDTERLMLDKLMGRASLVSRKEPMMAAC